MEHLLRLIQENKIVKFVAPTGYGKTTILPKELGEAGYRTTVIVSNKNIADSLNKLSFQNVTYIEDKKYLTFYEHGSLKISQSEMHEDILIIDELDNGSLNNFLIISMWMKSKKDSKLVLNSLKSHSLFPEYPYYTVPPSLSTVEVRYTKDIPMNEIRIQDFITEFANLIYKLHHSTVEGNFLIFMVAKYRENLEKVLSDMNFNFKEYKRKIIVISDYKKTHLKENNFGAIFDCMYEERFESTLTGGVRKRIAYISKRDAEIRALRSSNSSVIVYRMISQDTFRNLPDVTDEELFRIPLHHLMIDIYERNLNPFEILSSFDISELDFIYTLFLNYGILDITRRLTPKAKMLRKLSFGLRPALLYLETNSIVLSSLIDNYMGSPFLFSQEKFIPNDYSVADYQIDSQSHIRQYYNRFRGDSDCETFLNLYNDSLNSSLSPQDLHEWCIKNDISYEYMKNVYDSIELSGKNRETVNVAEMIKNIDLIMTSLYSDRKMRIDSTREVFIQYIRKDRPYNIDSLSINLIEEKRPKEIYGLITCQISDFHVVSFSYVSIQSKFLF